MFEALFDPDIIDQRLWDINKYKARKKMQNTPVTETSCFEKWTDVTEKELLKFHAVIMVMGLDSGQEALYQGLLGWCKRLSSIPYAMVQSETVWGE